MQDENEMQRSVRLGIADDHSDIRLVLGQLISIWPGITSRFDVPRRISRKAFASSLLVNRAAASPGRGVIS